MFLSFMPTKTLYSLLPALLDTNPFSSEEKEKEKEKDGAQGAEGEEEKEGEAEVDDVCALPPKVAGLVEVYRCSLMLSREACLSPPLTSQTFGYLFFFTNTSLLNTLLERGEGAEGVGLSRPMYLMLNISRCDHVARGMSPSTLSVIFVVVVVIYELNFLFVKRKLQYFFSLKLDSPLSYIISKILSAQFK